MNEKEFKNSFVSTFLATWSANNFEKCCSTGTQERLSNPPVEDAFFLADEAWNKIKSSGLVSI